MAVPNRDEVRDFLTTRRAKVRPHQVDVPTAGNRRARPAPRGSRDARGVSVEYYARLEQGNLAAVSDAVLDAIAYALHLTTPNVTTCSGRTASESGGPSPRAWTDAGVA